MILVLNFLNTSARFKNSFKMKHVLSDKLNLYVSYTF